jgi:hypothetical protein
MRNLHMLFVRNISERDEGGVSRTTPPIVWQRYFKIVSAYESVSAETFRSFRCSTL